MRLVLFRPSSLQIYKRGRNINRLTIVIPRPKARLHLGTPNPPMIAIAEETLGFRRSGLSPDLRLLIPTFSLPNAPARFTAYLHSKLGMLPYHVPPKAGPLTYADLTQIVAETATAEYLRNYADLAEK